MRLEARHQDRLVSQMMFGQYLKSGQRLVESRFMRPFESGARGVYLFGTDELGRDVLSRTIQAARLTMFIALMSTAIGAMIMFWSSTE